jgi:glyoxylase-like metal-dependent hydrolase (beta-lactamase superfamily II)
MPAAGGGWWLVDTGLGLPAVREAWQPLLARYGLTTSLRGILVTHHHPDHFGMAGWLAQSCNVSVTMSTAAFAAGARQFHNLHMERIAPFAERWGVDYPRLVQDARARHVFRSVVGELPPLAAPLEDHGEFMATQLPLKISLHDGHAEGHACLHAEAAGLFIAGDELLPTISSNVSLYPQGGLQDPMGAHLASLRRLRSLPINVLVLPAHGRPFRGAHARLDALDAEHDERLGQLLEFAGVPRSAVEMANCLFGHRPLEGMNLLLAMGETLAHLQYLLGTGALLPVAASAVASADTPVGCLSPYCLPETVPYFMRAQRA